MGGNEAYPDVFQPFGGFADDMPVENGRVALLKSRVLGMNPKLTCGQS